MQKAHAERIGTGTSFLGIKCIAVGRFRVLVYRAPNSVLWGFPPSRGQESCLGEPWNWKVPQNDLGCSLNAKHMSFYFLTCPIFQQLLQWFTKAGTQCLTEKWRLFYLLRATELSPSLSETPNPILPFLGSPQSNRHRFFWLMMMISNTFIPLL